MHLLRALEGQLALSYVYGATAVHTACTVGRVLRAAPFQQLEGKLENSHERSRVLNRS